MFFVVKCKKIPVGNFFIAKILFWVDDIDTPLGGICDLVAQLDRATAS